MAQSREHDIFPEGHQVVIGVGDDKKLIEVYPMSRKKRRASIKGLVGILTDITKEKPDLDLTSMDVNALQTLIPLILEKGDERLLEVYVASTRQDHEWLDDNMTTLQEVDLLSTILEVEKVEDIVKNFKGITAKFNLGERLQGLVKSPLSKNSLQITAPPPSTSTSGGPTTK